MIETYFARDFQIPPSFRRFKNRPTQPVQYELCLNLIEAEWPAQGENQRYGRPFRVREFIELYQQAAKQALEASPRGTSPRGTPSGFPAANIQNLRHRPQYLFERGMLIKGQGTPGEEIIWFQIGPYGEEEQLGVPQGPPQELPAVPQEELILAPRGLQLPQEEPLEDPAETFLRNFRKEPSQGSRN